MHFSWVIYFKQIVFFARLTVYTLISLIFSTGPQRLLEPKGWIIHWQTPRCQETDGPRQLKFGLCILRVRKTDRDVGPHDSVIRSHVPHGSGNAQPTLVVMALTKLPRSKHWWWSWQLWQNVGNYTLPRAIKIWDDLGNTVEKTSNFSIFFCWVGNDDLGQMPLSWNL